MAAGTARGDTRPARGAVDGRASETAAAVGFLRLRAAEPVAERTFLRIGRDVFPVYGDALRGWSPRVGDFYGVTACSPYVYGSLDELFFALVNLCTGPRGEA